MKKDVYRKAALERLATVDQLDKVMKITSPMSWLALLGVTVIIVAALVWSIIGSLPYTITAEGVIVSSTTATNTLHANGAGTVTLCVAEGQYINIGDVFARITPSGSYDEAIECVSDQQGWVTKILKTKDNKDVDREYVDLGAELVRIRPYPRKGQKQVAVCYVLFSDIGKIKPDSPATVTLKSKNSSEYGHMDGRVINIDKLPTSTSGIEEVVGSDNNMSQQFVKEGMAVCAVTLELKADSTSKNGYYWSNKNGKEEPFNDMESCIVKITTHEETPIFKLFTQLKDFVKGESK